MNGHRFTISPAVRKALKETERKYGIPYMGAIAVCARESDCNPKSINSSSVACGLFQFMTNKTATLYEVMYKFGDDDTKALIKRDTSHHNNKGQSILHYEPVNENARKQALRLCLNPEFNATMWAKYHGPKVENYNDWLGNRKISGGEFTGMNNLGLGGLKALAEKAWQDKATDKSTLTIDFFKENRKLYGGSMKANATLVYHKNGSLKTVRESYAELFKFGGYGELQKVDPDSGETTLANLALENN